MGNKGNGVRQIAEALIRAVCRPAAAKKAGRVFLLTAAAGALLFGRQRRGDS